MKGFTLFELALTLTLITLLAMGGSTLYFSLSRYRVQSEMFHLFHALHFARSEAIKRNQRVTVCPSKDFQSCLKESKNWSKGYIILDQDNALLRVKKNAPRTRLRSKNTNPIRFHGDGHCSTPTTLIFSTEVGSNQRITIIFSGRIKIRRK